MQSITTKLRSWFSYAFNLPILQKSRFPWVDYLRGIAIILVVYRHVLLGLETSGLVIPAPLVTANMIFFSFRMPLFFILSGLFISGSLKKRSLGQFTLMKFENLIYPYLVWASIQITLQIFMSGSSNANRDVSHFLLIFYQPRALDQFWYLPALFNATIVYVLLKQKLHIKPAFQLLVGIGFYFLAPYVDKISMLSDWMSLYIFFALGDAISSFFFHERTQRFMKSYYSFILMIPVFILTQLYYLRNETGHLELLIIALIGCLSMFILSFRLQAWEVLKFLRVFGFHSLYIYVMHVIIAAAVRTAMRSILHVNDPTVLLFCGIAAGVIIPVIIYNLFVRDNWAWFLFSFKKPVKKKPVTDIDKDEMGKLAPASRS